MIIQLDIILLFFLKDWNKIIEQIARAIVDKYGEGNYDFLGNNCEDFANMIIYGLNFSQQASYSVKSCENHSITMVERILFVS